MRWASGSWTKLRPSAYKASRAKNSRTFSTAPRAVSPAPSHLLHHLRRHLHRHTALQQVDTHDECRPASVPQLHATLEAFQRPGNDPDAIAGPDPRQRAPMIRTTPSVLATRMYPSRESAKRRKT